MSEASAHKATQRKSDYREAFRDHNESLYAATVFAGSDNYKTKLRAIQTVERPGCIETLARSGLMHVEIAFDAPDDSLTLEHIEAGRDRLSTAIERDPKITTTTLARAAITLSCIDSFQYLALLNRIPGKAQHQKAFQNTLEVGVPLRNQYLARGLDMIQRGNLAEINILLLLQRFAIKNGGTEWMALPSLFSNGNCFGGKPVKNSWDLTVYTQYDEGKPKETYKIQVKSSQQAAERGDTYADDIVEIIADTHLASPRNRAQGHKLPIYCVVEDCLVEAGIVCPAYDRNMDPTVMLDKRTEWLLDALDNPDVI